MAARDLIVIVVAALGLVGCTGAARTAGAPTGAPTVVPATTAATATASAPSATPSAPSPGTPAVVSSAPTVLASDTPSPTPTVTPVAGPAQTTVSISASSTWNGIPTWSYVATAVVRTSNASGVVPQGTVRFHFSDGALANADQYCTLTTDGSCSVQFADTLLYYVVTATYLPTAGLAGSTSATTRTGR